ncbi:penicillin acylase family protein [Cystobacter fuscus]|nr:penicillin acylase family protein [Cystobacter fuscus]
MRSPCFHFLVVLGLAMLSACEGGDEQPAGIKATIRRTSYGIPHITAEDYRGVGAGLGYAQAQDAVCTLADQILKVRGERASYFGPGAGEANIDSDLTYLGLGLLARAQAAYDQQSPAMKELVEGFADGYNHYLENTPAENLPAPCTGASWVKPIRGVDLLAYHLDLSLLDSLAPLLGYVANAQPPLASVAVSSLPPGGPPLPRPRDFELGSNGWALGRERTSGGGGMLVANPHFPWEGALRFYESHLTLPGKLDVYGGSLLGMPVINIGFNRDVAWTHTVTSSSHFVVYRLTLPEGDPTSYEYDGRTRKMTREEHTIRVREADGTFRQVKRTFWRSHHGPMLNGPGAEWTSRLAYTIRDANEGNHYFAEQWLRMNEAGGLDELSAAQAEVRGIPWVNTLAASADGRTRYEDASRVPQLSAETIAAYRLSLERDADTRFFEAQHILLLDGSTSRDEWVGLEDTTRGLMPVENAPHLVRTDFVMNANDSPIYSNPAEPLRNIPFPYEVYATAQGRLSPRAHMNLTLLTEQGKASPAGADGRFTRSELEHAILSNRAWLAEQLLAPVVSRCQGVDTVDLQGEPVRIADACQALAAWDGRMELDRTGAVVWREFLGQFSRQELVDKGALFAQPFAPDQPLSTPSGLAPAPASGPDPLLEKLGAAVVQLTRAGIRVDARLGDVQFTRKGERVIPIHGGLGDLEGVANVVGYTSANSTLLPRTERQQVLSASTGLTTEGYPVNNGSSFLMVMEFTEAGPRASALLTYSQTTDPLSPRFSDQTLLFRDKHLRPVLFEEADIQADPALELTRLEFTPTSRSP